ncbi:hypothetical protein [Nostoc sp. PA-18-2419]|uniref:hypothetical protein n=1 Tax=Nostoc sp. PA-18-2419 TaxID=2575443 RepID=UPI001108DE43|nr:hypothetical protein [Nostoc sp. PA-18-2419]
MKLGLERRRPHETFLFKRSEKWRKPPAGQKGVVGTPKSWYTQPKIFGGSQPPAAQKLAV